MLTIPKTTKAVANHCGEAALDLGTGDRPRKGSSGHGLIALIEQILSDEPTIRNIRRE
jgi:hypothetical protein